MTLHKERASLGKFVLVLMLIVTSAGYAVGASIPSDFPNAQGGNNIYAHAYNPLSGVIRNLAGTGSYMYSTAGQPSGRTAVGMISGNLTLWPCVNGSTYGTEWAVVSYQAPQDGIYSFTGRFFGTQTGNTTEAYIFVNTTGDDNLIGDNVWQKYIGGLASETFNQTQELKQGQLVRFAVDAWNGSHSYDVTGLEANISNIAPASTPEPASLATLITGLVGLATLRRRKR